jgi:GPCR proteolysis site, GPS, motif
MRLLGLFKRVTSATFNTSLAANPHLSLSPALSRANGQWDTEGCRVLSSTHWYTVCECNHLSSFALLMDVHGYIVCINCSRWAHSEAKIVNATLFQAQSKALEILGIVCSALSVVCLAMTLLLLNVLKYGIVSFEKCSSQNIDFLGSITAKEILLASTCVSV